LGDTNERGNMKRKKLKGGFVLTAGLIGLLTCGAFAFFVGSFTAESSHTGTIGAGGTGVGTLAATVSFPEAELSPTKAVPLTMLVNNTAGRMVTFHKLAVTITPEASGCLASWFSVKAVKLSEGGESVTQWEGWVEGKEEKAVNIAAGEHAITPSNIGINLVMKNEATSQAVCENTSIKVVAKVS
jgi:hypothetical protein